MRIGDLQQVLEEKWKIYGQQILAGQLRNVER